ncbi:hypothetical protein BV20DRAFT_1058239 [Pilatotrama ljubarskyi]|nr:hypothetical protein BV20DRAFT_1058239 [Pilatotrama ljubarskyi]
MALANKAIQQRQGHEAISDFRVAGCGVMSSEGSQAAATLDTPPLLASALAALSTVRGDIKDLCLSLDQSIRKVIEPVGISFSPSTWRKEVKRVFVHLNKDYRTELVTDIMHSARKLKQQKGLDYIFERITAAREAETRIVVLLEELTEFRRENREHISYPDIVYLAGHTARFNEALNLVRQNIADASTHLQEWRLYLELLASPSYDVKAAIYFLRNTVSQEDNVHAAKGILACLADLYDQRQEMSANEASIGTRTVHLLCACESSTPPSAYDENMRTLQHIKEQLQAQVLAQGTLLDEFSSYVKSASSTPQALVSFKYPEGLSLERLRVGHLEHQKIIHSLNNAKEVYEPLETALKEILKFLQNKFAASDGEAV